MPASKPKIAVIYYSLYLHIHGLAQTAAQGAREAGAKVDIFRFPELLSEEVLLKQFHGQTEAKNDRDAKVNLDPVIKTTDLEQYDGYIFAFPTRYGRAIAQVDAFFDQTGGLWVAQKLSGKMATILTSTGTQHGGQETTVLTTLPFLVHHGIIYVPMGYSTPKILQMNEIAGGSPYGAATLAGATGTRQPTELELEIAAHHGNHFTKILTQYVNGATA